VAARRRPGSDHGGSYTCRLTAEGHVRYFIIPNELCDWHLLTAAQTLDTRARATAGGAGRRPGFLRAPGMRR
jgi:hypothetical protein